GLNDLFQKEEALVSKTPSISLVTNTIPQAQNNPSVIFNSSLLMRRDVNALYHKDHSYNFSFTTDENIFSSANDLGFNFNLSNRNNSSSSSLINLSGSSSRFD